PRHRTSVGPRALRARETRELACPLPDPLLAVRAVHQRRPWLRPAGTGRWSRLAQRAWPLGPVPLGRDKRCSAGVRTAAATGEAWAALYRVYLAYSASRAEVKRMPS